MTSTTLHKLRDAAACICEPRLGQRAGIGRSAFRSGVFRSHGDPARRRDFGMGKGLTN